MRTSITLTLGTVAAAPGIVVGGGHAALAPEPSTGGRPRAGAAGGLSMAEPPGVAAPSAAARPPADVGTERTTGEPEGGPAGDAQAARLGRRFSVQLVDARRLGVSTHDGWRYNQILAALTDAYHGVVRQGRAAAASLRDLDIDRVDIDPDAIAIAYRDGTRHVIAGTADGLVVLYVATDPATRSKVDEAERALAALRRLGDGSRS